MFKYIKQFLSNISFKVFTHIFEDKIIRIIISSITGTGVWYMSNSIIGGIFTALGLLGTLWLLKLWLNEIKSIINKQNNIKNKVFILAIQPHIVSNGKKTPKYGLGFNIYFANCTPHIIDMIFDPTRTKVMANGQGYPTTKYPIKQLLPYEYNIHNAVRTYYIKYEEIIIKKKQIDLHLNIVFQYSINNCDIEKHELSYTYKGKCKINETNQGPHLELIFSDLQSGLLN